MSQNSDIASPQRRIIRTSLTLTICMGFASCSNFSASDLAKKSASSVSKSASSVSKSVSKSASSVSQSVSKSVAKIVPSRVPLATVRTKDLKKMPTGADRALAWDKHLNRKRYVSYTPTASWAPPKGYKAPTLPDDRGIPVDGGLLPPLRPGQGTTLDASGELPQQ